MSWYSSTPGSVTYAYRAVITVPLNASAGDLQVTVPPDWDLFWQTIQADGDDVRITDTDGTTLLTFEMSTFTYASRIMVLDIDAAANSLAAAALWIYFGNASATTGVGSFAQAGLDPGYIELAQPSGVVFEMRNEEPGVTVPSQRFAKTADSDLLIWWRLDGLQTRRTPYNNHIELEEVTLVSGAVYLAGAAQAGMTDDSKIRVVQGDDGAMYGRMYVDDGTTNTDYTVEFAIITTFARTLRGRALLDVYDVAEP